LNPEELIAQAQKVRENAYAPYSGFKVGAALLTVKGNVYTGCNIENSSYGLTVCAERAAVAKAISEGERQFEAIAINAPTGNYCSPCGACRQVLLEFGAGIEVYMSNDQGEYKLMNVGELLPAAFELKVKDE